MQNRKTMIGLSGGINFMAVLCQLIEQEDRPKEIWLYYAHFDEHSPDTFDFVLDGILYAQKHFEQVHWKITYNSVLKYFERSKMIPHPASSPCTKVLKIEPMSAWAFENGINVDLVGYVKHELNRRGGKQQKAITRELFPLEKEYPVGNFTDEWCIEMCDKHIGWHPAIYDIVDEFGKRKFKHNNCLPCKNMTIDNMKAVQEHYPDHHAKAMELSDKLQKYWGRDEVTFYAEFGRDLGQSSTCEACKF
jgi:hypothetical protein